MAAQTTGESQEQPPVSSSLQPPSPQAESSLIGISSSSLLEPGEDGRAERGSKRRGFLRVGVESRGGARPG